MTLDGVLAGWYPDGTTTDQGDRMPADPVPLMCGATAHMCKCRHPFGHIEAGDPDIHECEDDEACDGAWRGDIDTDDFQVVRLPGGISLAEAILSPPRFMGGTLW